LTLPELDLVLRPAEAADIEILAEIVIAARRAAPMPDSPHDADQVGCVLAACLEVQEIWVAERAGEIVGYLRLVEDWIDDLYVAPRAQRAGVGTALLSLVKALRPAGFGLWAFESNAPARAFYASHGMVEGAVTDGFGNPEQAPDLAIRWPGPSV